MSLLRLPGISDCWVPGPLKQSSTTVSHKYTTLSRQKFGCCIKCKQNQKTIIYKSFKYVVFELKSVLYIYIKYIIWKALPFRWEMPSCTIFSVTFQFTTSSITYFSTLFLTANHCLKVLALGLMFKNTWLGVENNQSLTVIGRGSLDAVLPNTKQLPTTMLWFHNL